MPYACTVIRCEGSFVELDVEAEQPDAEPFYRRDDFALGLLLGAKPGALTDALGDEEDGLERIAGGLVDAARFIRSVVVSANRKGSVRDDTAPVCRYVIEATDPKWIASLAEGMTWESYAWSDSNGPFLDEDELYEPRIKLPVEAFRPFERVSVRPSMPIVPGELHGRGVVCRAKTVENVPSSWEGGQTAYLIELDHGPVAWAFAECLRRPPADSYERAWDTPEAFWASLLENPPLERARALHFLGLRGGGALQLPGASVEGTSAWMFGLFRRLPLDGAISVAARLLDGWLTDSTARSRKFDRATPGRELAAGDTIEAYQFECDAPMAFVLGALTLLFAEHRGEVTGPGCTELAHVLERWPTALFGYSNWRALAAYPLAACTGSPPTLPDWVIHGRRRDGEELWVEASELDLYRP